MAIAGCNDVTLARGLNERDAKDLSAALNRRGIAVSQREENGERYALAIAESAVPAAWEAHAMQCREKPTTPTTSSAVLGTREAELRNREQSLETRLESAIQKLPNVRSATVLLTLARPDNKLSDLLHPASTAAPRVLLSLVCSRKSCPSTSQLQPLLSAAIPELSASNVRVITQLETEAEPPCAELGHIGPLTVTRASLPTLKLWLAVSLVLHMLSSLALLYVFQRKRQQQKP